LITEEKRRKQIKILGPPTLGIYCLWLCPLQPKNKIFQSLTVSLRREVQPVHHLGCLGGMQRKICVNHTYLCICKVTRLSACHCRAGREDAHAFRNSAAGWVVRGCGSPYARLRVSRNGVTGRDATSIRQCQVRKSQGEVRWR
jgi:hypothetical protein